MQDFLLHFKFLKNSDKNSLFHFVVKKFCFYFVFQSTFKLFLWKTNQIIQRI
jgi:hypothetical protein